MTTGFDKEYWLKNYSQPKEMDGIGNAKVHARYLKSYFELEQIEVKTILDLGFGLGYMSQAMIRAFTPWRYYGIEPSAHAYELGAKRLRKSSPSRMKTECVDLFTWAKNQTAEARWFDLTICTSVFQYLSDDELLQIMPILARLSRYLYLTVPTDVELDKQINELKFFDEYALRRSKEFYFDLIGSHFTLISSRLWESKLHFDETSTQVSDLLYRV